MYNFSELKTICGRMVQRVGDTDYALKLGDWLNLSQSFLANVYDYYNELETIHNFSTASGTENYYMPLHFDKPLRIYDLTNNTKLNIITEEEYFDSNISNISGSTTGKPRYARLFGTKGINANISVSGTIVKVKSDSASDTSGIVVRVEGYTDSSKTILDYENITVSTSTPTTFVSGTKTFYDILHTSKSGDTTGTITIANSSDTTIASLFPTARVARYKVMKLGLIPNATISMRVLFKRKTNKLVNDYDYPFIDADEFFINDTCGYALAQEKETVDRANVYFSKAKDALDGLMRTQANRLGPDYQHRIENIFIQAHRA